MRKLSPLFSVIINNYNYEKYVKTAIESVLNQTLADFELIIVDDGSSDGSRDIIGSFKDGRIKTILKDNGGQASAINAGFASARGEYIAFLDSDDTFDPEKLETIYEIYKSGDYAIVQHMLRSVDAEGRELGKNHPGGLIYGHCNLFDKYKETSRTNFFSATSGITAPRKYLRNIFPVNEDRWRICADVPIFRPLALMGMAYTFKEPLGGYRIHGENGWMNTKEQAEKAVDMICLANDCTNSYIKRWGLDYKLELPVPVETVKRLGRNELYLYGAGRHTLRLLKEGHFAKIAGIIDDSPSAESMMGIPVISSGDYKYSPDHSILVSSDIYEQDMLGKALSKGWDSVFGMYTLKTFKNGRTAQMKKLSAKLREDGIKRIAIYGAGRHTLNLLLSGMLPHEIAVDCILDDGNSGRKMHGIDVIKPEDAVWRSFDAVLTASDVNERALFYKALQHGFKRIYCMYAPPKAAREHYADYREIINFAAVNKKEEISLYGMTYYTAILIQSGVLDGYCRVKEIIDFDGHGQKSFNGIPLVSPEKASEGLIAVPPVDSSKNAAEMLKDHDKANLLIIRKNVDEVAIVHKMLTHKEKGVMADVGAHMGYSLMPFADMGWQVYAFEPEPSMRRNLIRNTKKYDNVFIESRALSDREIESMPIYKSDMSSGISTLSPFHASHKPSGIVTVTTFAKFTAEQNIENIDFMKVDTEGYDLFVLKGNDWEKCRPKIVMCEFENLKTVKLGYEFYDMADYLHGLGYRVIISEWEPVFEYGRQPRWNRFVEYPCLLKDEAAYGNILAFDDDGYYDAFMRENRVEKHD